MPDYLETTIDKFTFKVALDRLYNPEGLWVKAEGRHIRIGLSDYLQQHSGDIAFVEVKSVGTNLKLNDEFASIETIKVDITLFSPLTGKLAAVNSQIEHSPEIINQDPYGEAWMVEIEPSSWEMEQTKLLNAEDYFNKMKQEAEDEVRLK
ncbi:MAG: glycine cleavage system protein H [Anaerolineaceae bacterium]|nr:glycine cleavage system protein H [Anaerolineaceae bacterium]